MSSWSNINQGEEFFKVLNNGEKRVKLWPDAKSTADINYMGLRFYHRTDNGGIEDPGPGASVTQPGPAG